LLYSLFNLFLHENELSVTLGERKKAPTKYMGKFSLSVAKTQFSWMFLCSSPLLSAFLCG
ncbi:MAG: hypothetical protein RBS43_04220, partial [Candidatus Cloacimonas sp.]|nr:hypothetical protein [Candidatus Cloacimonas sp.]